MSVDARICHRCLTRLGPADDVIMEVVAEDEARPTEHLSKAQRLILAARSRRRLLLQIAAGLTLVVVAVTSWWVYRQFIWEPAPVPTAAGARDLPLPGTLWPTEHGDVGSTRATPASVPFEGDVAWSRDFDAPTTTALTTDGERLFVGLANARLLALSVEDGSEVWSRAVPGQLDVAPTVADGVLYIAQRDGLVLALDPATGDQIWAFNGGGPHFTAPFPYEGTLYTAGQRDFRGLDAESGDVLWERGGLAHEDFTIQPVVEDEKVALAVSNRLFVHERLTLHRENSFRTSRMRYVAVSDDAIVGVGRREIVVIDQSATPYSWDGLPLVRAIWSQGFLWNVAPAIPRDSNLWTERVRERYAAPRAPAIGEGRLFVALASGDLRARGLRSGDELWTRAPGEPITGDPLLTGDGLLVPRGPWLQLLDPETGDEIWRRTLDGQVISSVTVTEGGTYAAVGVFGLITGRSTVIALR
ncbi:MAG: PQQ-binding-like beta-propeller repeat protein [Chloroflexi bacterium]|nr:PQQ-binding-like beta-propeller repeat protein [Chloroflexota bacterium]